MSELFKTLGVMPLSAEIYTKSGVEELVNNAVTGGVTSLLKFVGISSTDPLSEGGATVTGVSAFVEGNVVLWKPEGSSEYSEYVYATVDGSLKWERLGDASRIGQLEQRVSTAESDIEALEGRVTTAEGEIDALQADIATKAASADLTALAGRVTTAEGEIDALQAAVATKAESSVVTAIDGRVTTVEGAVATKAEASVVTAIDGRVTTAEGEIDALQAAVATKAEAADVVSKDKLLVLTEDSSSNPYYEGSHDINLFDESGANLTVSVTSGSIYSRNSIGMWELNSDSLIISDESNASVAVRKTDINLTDYNNGDNLSITTIGLVKNGFEFTYPESNGQLALTSDIPTAAVSALEAKVAADKTAAGTAKTALTGVTNVNELISVLNTFFSTVGA